VSFLEGAGTPSMVDRTTIRPPAARIGPITADERKAVMANSPVKGKYDQTVDPQSAYEVLQKRLAAGGALPRAGTPAGAGGAPSSPGGPAEASAEGGVFHKIGSYVGNFFGIGRPRGQPLTTSQQVARNVARAIAVGVGTQVAAELTKASGSRTAGTIGKAIVRGTLGGVMRR